MAAMEKSSAGIDGRSARNRLRGASVVHQDRDGKRFVSALAPAFAVGALIVLMAAHADVSAQTATPRDRLVVSTSWLANHLDDANLVLLHVGDRAGYDAGHIPGARYIGMDDVSLAREPGALTLQLPPLDELRSRLAARGISDDSRVVIYWGKDWVSQVTRIVFALDYAGLGDGVSVLDGGMPAWVSQERPLTTAVPADQPGRLATRSANDLVVTVDWVAEHVRSPRPSHVLVDARDAVYYDGVEASQGRNGHIPGALNVPYRALVDESMHIASTEDLMAMFNQAGVKPGDVVVGYCHIGQQASALLFVARLLGHEVRLFDGSMQEWARDSGRPVETGRR